jgi:hypothetical protein
MMGDNGMLPDAVASPLSTMSVYNELPNSTGTPLSGLPRQPTPRSEPNHIPMEHEHPNVKSPFYT